MAKDGSTVTLNHCFSGMRPTDTPRPSVAEAVKSGLPDGVVVYGVNGLSEITFIKLGNSTYAKRDPPMPSHGWVVYK
jgi:hypothetical protein